MQHEPDALTYKLAGVDRDLADAFIERIAPLTVTTRNPGVMGEIGSFGALFDISSRKYKHPILVASTDGVGTKLQLAMDMNRHDTIGMDLVAMNVNDILVTGADPLFFLDYLATGKLDMETHTAVINGIITGCQQAQCALIGGETAELPGFFHPRQYELAGFSVGIAERDALYAPENISENDTIIGLPSSGIHSNGYSLIRKIFHDRNRFPWERPLDGSSEPLGDVLLKPTRIYTDDVRYIRRTGMIHAMAHITGGGMIRNVARILPNGFGAIIRKETWPVPDIFRHIQILGNISENEMARTFNMGIGMVMLCRNENAEIVEELLANQGICAYRIGSVCRSPGVHFTGRSPDGTSPSIQIPAAKSSTISRRSPRIAILGSGSGTNMEAICQAIQRKDLPAEVVCVISNNSRSGILEKARHHDLPVYHISHQTHPVPETFCREMLTVLRRHGVDFICLAGYMKKLPAAVIEAYRDRVINIHPALLPAFGGKGMYGPAVHDAVIRSGAKYTGVTVHIVTEEYDQGRILAQRVVSVLPEDDPEHLAQRILNIEHDLYWRVLKEVCRP